MDEVAMLVEDASQILRQFAWSAGLPGAADISYMRAPNSYR
jgi:hypothetical protein